MQRRMPLVFFLLSAAALVIGCQNQKSQTAQTPELPPAAATATVPPPEPYVPPPAPEPAPTVREPVVVSTPAPTLSRPRTYTVQKGDTLIGIARRFYGNPAKYKDIAAANNLADPNRIRVGQVLVLP